MNKLSCYYISSYRVPRIVFQYIHGLTEKLLIPGDEEEQNKLRKKYHIYISHIYVNMRLKSIETDDEKTNVRVPIPCDLIWEKMGRDFDMELLIKNALMCRSGYKHNGTKGNGRCRVYWLPDEIFNQACALHTSTVFDDWDKLLNTGNGQATVNLISGSSMAKPTKKNLYLNDTKLEKAPKLIKQSMDCLQPCTINPHLIIPWAKKAEDKYKREQMKLDQRLSTLKKRYPEKKMKDIRQLVSYRRVEMQRNRARGLHNNLVTCLTTILNRNPTEVPGSNGKFWTYNAAYRLQKSGRVGEIHGGFQNICTPAKQLLLTDVHYHNYDIKSCQAVILAEELRKNNLRCEWLETYNRNKSLRQKYADEVGITVGCWIDAFYAIIMGAEAGLFGAPLKAIRKEIKDKEEAKAAAERFIDIVEDLLDKSEKWRELLLTIKSSSYVRKQQDQEYYGWRNKCGMTFPGFVKTADNKIISSKTKKTVTGIRAIAKLKRGLAAFYLQGTEAYVIHNLTIACTEYGIPVYKNEHDGIIVGDKIPSHIFRKVAIEAGYPDLQIANKDICDDQKYTRYTNYINSK